MLGKTEGRGRSGQHRMRWLDGIINPMDISLASAGSWWWTGKPGVLHSTWSLTAGHNWATEQHEPRGIHLNDRLKATCPKWQPLLICTFPSFLPSLKDIITVYPDAQVKASASSLIPSIFLPLMFDFCKVYPVKVKVAQSCPTLCNPTDYTVHAILQARILEWVVFPFSTGSSQPRDQTQVSWIAGGFFTSWARRFTLCLLKIFHNYPFLSISTHHVLS